LRRYEPAPCYAQVGGEIERGWPARPDGVLAIDGPAALPWDAVAAAVGGTDIRDRRLPEDEQLHDQAFARVPLGTLADRLRDLPTPSGRAVVLGPGSALVPHDELWYADLPKRLHRDPDERRMRYVDWPLQDRHKQEVLPSVDRYLDLTNDEDPRSLRGEALRTTLAALARRPFRTRPTFLPGPWGGQWLRGRLGIETDAPNLAWSYELISPEAGILLGELEVGFELLMAQESETVLGQKAAARFGRAFPIRFDYLDTMAGGHLSIQCHPREEYARTVFGLDFTQLESYYVMETTPGAKIFLGLRDDADVAAFERDARAALDGRAFNPERHVQAHDAERHRLYLIPAGTVHASGAGNVVLEISATPYLYTLRFYDWLRTNLDGRLRPVHVDHAFANLDPARRGNSVPRDLIQEPRTVRSGDGWTELDLGGLPELFYAVHRLDFVGAVSDETCGRFHLLNLVEGEEIAIETAAGDVHPLAYAETIVVPAAVGAYRLVGAGKVVKAFVR
jgi:mannose-6-phosphate isomerase class I